MSVCLFNLDLGRYLQEVEQCDTGVEVGDLNVNCLGCESND